MATMSTERPNFWRAPQGYRQKPRPQSCIWTPPVESQTWSPSPTYSQDTNSLPRTPKIQSGSPAFDAGLRPGDVLLNVGNRSATNPPMTHQQARDIINSTANTLNVQVQRPQGRSSGTPHSSTSISPVYSSSEQPSSHTPYRPVPVQRGVIPSIHTLDYDSSIRRPDSNTEEYLRDKAIEQWAISKQTYRTLPLIEPRPKVRRDWPTGCYMRHMDGPFWHDVPRTIVTPSPAKLQNVMTRYGHNVQQNNPGVVHLQYNSPINMYSDENVANTLRPRPVSPAPPPRPGSVPPHMMTGQMSHLQKPITVDITQSPTYQLLQEEEETREYRHQNESSSKGSHLPVGHTTGPASGQHSHSPIGLHSPSYPTQTPYFKSLMNSLLPNPGI